jgi:hypothetical protein
MEHADPLTVALLPNVQLSDPHCRLSSVIKSAPSIVAVQYIEDEQCLRAFIFCSVKGSDMLFI